MLQMQHHKQQLNCSDHTLEKHETTRFNRKSTSTLNSNNKPSTTSIMKKNQNTESVKKWILKSIVSFKATDSENKPVQTPPQVIRYPSHDNDVGIKYNNSPVELIRTDDSVDLNDEAIKSSTRKFDTIKDDDDDVMANESTTYSFCRHAIRSTNMDKSIEAKKKVIRMLFVIIVEFFVCWAPIHILNTVGFCLFKICENDNNKFCLLF